MAIEVITVALTSVATLVASRRPPSPTSRTAKATLASRRATNAMAVIASKNVGSGHAPRATTRCSFVTAFTNAASEMASSPMRIRSRTVCRCGEV